MTIRHRHSQTVNRRAAIVAEEFARRLSEFREDDRQYRDISATLDQLRSRCRW